MLKGIIKKFTNREGQYQKFVAEINRLEPELIGLKDEELKAQSEELKKIIKNDAKKLNDFEMICRGFALVRETAKRTLNQRHFDVQLIAGLVLHQGKITEMLTGEGKTLAATLPAYFNALSGKGVHIITVNDYLARRDAVWMGQIYHFLGLNVACLTHEQSYIYDSSYTEQTANSKSQNPNDKSQEKTDKPQSAPNDSRDRERDQLGGFKIVQDFLRPVPRQTAYLADIVYGTNHEFGFDYLRDNLAYRPEDQAQRRTNQSSLNEILQTKRETASNPQESPFYYAILDEVDSILIDEARTPLIIAAPDVQSSEYYKIFSRAVNQLKPEEDYLSDEKKKSVSITEQGIDKIEKLLGIKNLFSPENLRLAHYLQESLQAKVFFQRDRHYIVKNGEVIIVDEFTGRLMPGRRYSGGLHQAIEAKESVSVKEENRTLAQITLQNYFRLYQKIAGMTGTAQTSAEEFHKVYNLEVISIPPNRPMVRKDLSDAVYKNQQIKYQMAIQEIKKRHQAGQPILIGTTSIENNEVISSLLSQAGIPHEVLNAKNHEREGTIIAQAGKLGAVTVATNMAGRGVDIVLGGHPPISEPEKTNQEIHQKWQEEQKKVIELGGLYVIGTERHEARRIDNQLIGRSGRQGDPGLSQFFLSLEDDLLRIFGGDRIKNLMQNFNIPDDLPIESKFVSKAINQAQAKVEGLNFDVRHHLLEFDDVLNKQRNSIYGQRQKILKAMAEPEQLQELLKELAGRDLINEEKNKLNQETEIFLCQQILRLIDLFWMEHLENLEALREAAGLRAYGQHEPLVEYRQEGYQMFRALQENLKNIVSEIIAKQPQIAISEKKVGLPAEALQGKAKVGRNDPCPCGAKHPDGRPIKYKHCHGK